MAGMMLMFMISFTVFLSNGECSTRNSYSNEFPMVPPLCRTNGFKRNIFHLYVH